MGKGGKSKMACQGTTTATANKHDNKYAKSETSSLEEDEEDGYILVGDEVFAKWVGIQNIPFSPKHFSIVRASKYSFPFEM